MKKAATLVLSLIFLITATSLAIEYKRFNSVKVNTGLIIGSEAGTLDTSAVMEVLHTTLGSIPCPKQTTTQRDAIGSPTEGLCVHNTTTNFLNFYDGSNWVAVVADTKTQTLTNKTLTTPTLQTSPIVADNLALADEATPSNPSAGYNKLYFKSDDKMYSLNSAGTETEIGSGGGGSAGINLFTDGDLDSNTTDEWNNSGSGAIAIVTAAATVGHGSYGLDFDAAAASDTATSDTFIIPTGLESQSCMVRFMVAGSDIDGMEVTVVHNNGGDLTIYDSSHASNQDIVNDSNFYWYTGYFTCPTLTTPGTDTLKVVFTADGNRSKMYLDRFHVGENTKLGTESFITGWTNDLTFVPNAGAFGTISNGDYWYRIVGDTLHVRGFFTAGTLAGGSAVITLPSNYTINGNKLPSATRGRVGNWESIRSAINFDANVRQGPIFVNQGDLTQVAFSKDGDATPDYDTAIGTEIAGNADAFAFEFSVPVNEVSQNTTITPDAHNWYIDANIGGALIDLSTSTQAAYVAPNDAALTLTQNTGSASVGISCSSTNDNTVGSTTCSAGNEEAGIVFDLPRPGTVRCEAAFGHRMQPAAGTDDMFVAFQLVETANGSQTLGLLGNQRVKSSIADNNVAAAYVENPVSVAGYFKFTSSGKKTIRLMYESVIAGTPTTNALLTNDDTAHGQQDFHIACSYIQQQYGPVPINNHVGDPQEIRMIGHAGYGSGLMIRYYTTTSVNTGSDLTLTTNDATDGMKVTINTKGMYTMTMTQRGSGTTDFYSGISLNSAQLTTAITGITAADRLCAESQDTTGAGNTTLSCSTTRILDTGDVIRVHTNGGVVSANGQFHIIRIL